MSKYTTKVIRTAGATALTAAFTLFSTGVFASTNGTSVVNTGSGVMVNTSVSDTTTTNVNNTNNATVSQSVMSNSNTGGNMAGGNIGGGSIVTGDAVNAASLDVDVNKNTTAVSMPAAPAMGDINATEVVNTGSGVGVNTSIQDTNTTTVNNTNNATVIQGVLDNANTGGNVAGGNIGGAGVVTGSAGSAVNMAVDANHNTTAVGSIGGDAGAMLNSTSVVNTGALVGVASNANSIKAVTVNNTNNGSFSQFANSNSNTGMNAVLGNSGLTGIATGNAVSAVEMGVGANYNTTGIGGSALAPAGVNMFDLVNTGSFFFGNSTNTSSLTTTANNTNNNTSVQALLFNSNTGYSHSGMNVGSSLISTGVSGTASSVHSAGNQNTTLIGSLVSLLGLLGI